MNSIVNENSSSRNIGEQSVPLVVPVAASSSSDTVPQLAPQSVAPARLPLQTASASVFNNSTSGNYYQPSAFGAGFPTEADIGKEAAPPKVDYFNVPSANGENTNESFVPKFFNPEQFVEARSPTQIDSTVLTSPGGPPAPPVSGTL